MTSNVDQTMDSRFSLYGQIFSGDAERLITYKDKVTSYAVGFGFI